MRKTTYVDALTAGYRVSAQNDPSPRLKRLCSRLGTKYHLATIDYGDVINRVIGDGWDVEIYPINQTRYNIALWKDHGCQLVFTAERILPSDVASTVERLIRRFVP